MQHWSPESIKLPIYSPEQMNPFHQALSQGLNTYSNIQNAAYLPQKLQADIASKAAYATMSPYSYMGKALSDPTTLLALMKNPKVFEQFMNKFQQMPTDPIKALQDQYGHSKPGLLTQLAEKIGLINKPAEQMAPAASMSNVQQPAQEAVPSTSGTPTASADSGMDIGPDGKNVVASDAQVGEKADQVVNASRNSAYQPDQVPRRTEEPSPAKTATSEFLPNWDERMQSILAQKYPYTDAAGKLTQNKEFQQEMGKENAKTAAELSKIYNQATLKEKTFKDLHGVLTNPTFENMRKVSLAGHYELAYFEKTGTPEQKALIGKARALMGNIIKDASSEFKGMFRKGEQELLENMKPTESDTVETMLGKLNELENLNQFVKQNSRLTALNLFAGKNPIEAQDNASKQLQYDDYIKQLKAHQEDQKSNEKNRWPAMKEPVNAKDVEGKMPPQGTVWMIRPDGQQVAVHEANIAHAMSKPLFYRRVE